MNTKKIKQDSTFIIAEISANHNHNIKIAIDSIKAIAGTGATAVKMQTYTPDTMTIDADNKYFKIKHPVWGGQTLYQLYKKAYTPWKWFKELKKIADDEGIELFSTAFDKSSVDLLESLDVKIHKIASFELVDLPLIEYVAKTGKPLILSTGMASISEIKDAVKTARENGAKKITLLKCVSSYPARPEEMNLSTIADMKKKFGCEVGLSDHTLGIASSVAAVALGAGVIEKHFILSRKIKSPDSFFSLEPDELKSLVDNIRVAEKAVGIVSYGMTKDEHKTVVFRRSLFVVKNIRRGDRFTTDNIRSIRPGYGIKPKYLDKVLGKRAVKNIKRGTPLMFDMLMEE